ncbi:hypothetical protein ACNKHN_16665 [Shigella flexneri]
MADAEEKGLIFVGLDIIGNRLTEINVTTQPVFVRLKQSFRCRLPEC